MAKAIDGSGAVDQAKMHACNGKNITDMSFLNFTIEKPPTMDVCPTPEIYPGSLLYREEVCGKLPVGFSVRQPTPCFLSQCSKVDLKKHDVPIRGTTDITTYNNTLYMSGVRTFDTWTAVHLCIGWMLQKTRRTRSRSIVGWSKGAKNSLPSCQCRMVLMVQIIFLSPSGPEHGGAMALALRTLGASTVKTRIQGQEKIPSCGTGFELSAARVLCSTPHIGVSMVVTGSKSAVG